MWTIDFKAVDAATEVGGKDLEPYVALIEGGRSGNFWKEIKEYFHYAQIRR